MCGGNPAFESQVSGTLVAGELHGSPLARLSLETLGSFNFGPISLLEFAREHVLQWLDDADISVRKAAALCAARILNRHVTETKRPVRHLVRCYAAEHTPRWGSCRMAIQCRSIYLSLCGVFAFT